ncbi:uncharacterized protein LOC111280859 isoform X1 [Durio zibethinus]|uniref:Uncharacterized protein LOC111280859 isoform X1 n=1 Tax=Durio zibethinus TaxID=66656 RepID=A0A6P5X929_DURZI|nr:uncharacterized protein LOC111280859 isoform X1 [Durio zibethinus]
MSEEEWIKEAMADSLLVAEVLLSLVQADPPPRLPPQEQSAKYNSASSSALQLEWSVRQRRSKQALRKKGEQARASPSTPLSWSGGTSVSGGGGADGSEESSRPSKSVENARSKVAATNDTTPPKRSRRKKTLAELKEEMSSHLKENKSLKNELEMVKLKFENLRATNETWSRMLQFEKERATNESSKRMKLDYQSDQARETAMAFVEQKNALSDLSEQREAACHTASVGCNENDPYMPNGSSEVQDTANCETSFMLPDLNLPVEDDSGCEVLHGIS